jgi:hypothetical protein
MGPECLVFFSLATECLTGCFSSPPCDFARPISRSSKSSCGGMNSPSSGDDLAPQNQKVRRSKWSSAPGRRNLQPASAQSLHNCLPNTR